LELEVAELQDGLKVRYITSFVIIIYVFQELKKTLQTIESAQHEDDQFITYITASVWLQMIEFKHIHT
jgi:hypothetical protein